MRKFTARLNEHFVVEVFLEPVPGAVDAFNFEAKDDWVIKTDLGPMYATRYQYTTVAAKKFKFDFACATAKAAIQQVIVEFINPLDKKLSEVFVKILPFYTWPDA